MKAIGPSNTKRIYFEGNEAFLLADYVIFASIYELNLISNGGKRVAQDQQLRK